MTDTPPPAPRAAQVVADTELMSNPEGDRRILRRAKELADQLNADSDAAVPLPTEGDEGH
jgi:hypothetical protein